MPLVAITTVYVYFDRRVRPSSATIPKLPCCPRRSRSRAEMATRQKWLERGREANERSRPRAPAMRRSTSGSRCRTRLRDRGRAARRRARLPALRPAAADGPSARLRSGPTRGGKHENAAGHPRSGAQRVDRKGGGGFGVGAWTRSRLHPDDPGRAVRDGDPVSRAREGVCACLAAFGARRARDETRRHDPLARGRLSVRRRRDR